MYRGLIHFHSCFSFDSILSIEKIVKFSLKNNLNFLVLTDHDTINGSLNLKDYVEKRNIDLEIIIAAEYKTEYGDVIALGIEHEITEMKFSSFIQQVKNQNGLLLFPHPYVGHKNIEEIAENADLIEIFNSRVDDSKNLKAKNLSTKHNKKTYYASDAHTYSCLRNAIVEFKRNGDFKSSLMSSRIVLIKKHKTTNIELIYSQFIKSIKKKNIKLFYNLLKSTIKQTISFKILKNI
ncbi:PHP domain-containing protein [Xenorhabdus budapestensis]|uniref:Phosphatase n=1 Tax=Xenorhabdus budapestensis TaxID=290110 RepID=A0A2D0IWB8_XENBU|nr:PHP domain-containing protein [Xenorhabdus budapestensis]PHM26220.1 phosphatase [Xenorhabdus budapestensis]